MLQIRNIKKTYSTHKVKVEALKGISLDFKETGLVFIVGKSGSGKSTLLNILGGLDKMSEGEIIIDGKSTRDFSSSDFDAFRNYYVGFIFQDFNLIDEITVYDNIALALKIQSKDHDTNTIEDALKMVGLEGLGYRKPNELSGGQRQRVSIARALVKDPHIILADEPTGALDSKTGEQLIVSLKTLSKNKLVIVVTHDEEMALNYGDEIIEIKDGEVINHFIANDELKENNQEEILPNLVKYYAGSEIINEEELNKKIDDNTTNYVCINTSKEIVSLAYSDSFPYLYERKEANNRFSSLENKANSEVKRTSEKKIKNRAHIKLKECIKMAMQSFKRKKNRFIALILISIASLYLFSLGWLFSTINVAGMVANKSNDLNLPFTYISKNDDDSLYFGVKKVLTDEDEKYLEDKYEISLNKTYSSSIEYAKTSSDSSSLFAMNSFSGLVEINDAQNLNFEVLGKSIPSEGEIIITDYAASELIRTGYVGKKNNKLSTIFPNDIDEILNTSIAFIAQDEMYQYYKIVGIIDTDYEKYQYLISKDYISIYLSEDTADFEILKNNVYSKIYVQEGFIKDNPLLFQRYIYGTAYLSFDFIYEGYSLEGDLSFTFESDDYFKEVKRLKDLDGQEIKWGNIPEKLEKNQIIIPYGKIKNYIEGYYEIDEFISLMNNKEFTFLDYYSDDTSYNLISEDIEIVAVVGDENSKDIILSDELYIEFLEKINSAQIMSFVLALPTTKETSERLLNELYIEGYSIGDVVNYDSLVGELVELIGPILIGVAVFFAIFAFLIVLNFISSSVRSRRKEVGILRSMGARNKDVMKIFGTEIVSMGIIITAITLFFVNNTVNSLNDMISGLISLTVFKDLFIFLVCLLFLFVASIIPLIKILKHNPIDAIKKVF